MDTEGATVLWRRCLRQPSRALPALEALVWAVASELGPIQVGPKITGAGGIHVQLDGLCKFQSGEMNIEMPFQDGRKLFHHCTCMSALALELRRIWWWSLLKIYIQNGPNPGLWMGTPFRGLEFHSEAWIGTILKADFRSTLAIMAPFSSLLRSPTHIVNCGVMHCEIRLRAVKGKWGPL